MTVTRRLFSPVGFTEVGIDDRFWSSRIAVNREATIPIEYKQCRDTGRIDGFDPAWTPGEGQTRHIFYDSDVAKWLEAASYSFATNSDPALDELMDEVIAVLDRAQQADGYLNMYFTTVEPGKRWTNLRDCHELYCAGHLIEAAVAHHLATGKRSLLDVMLRYVDHIDSVFGDAPGKKRGYCGHEEIELALVKLFHVTGDERHLSLAKYFVDERGREPNYFTLEAEARGETAHWAPLQYYQADIPVREQEKVVGHAVRHMYLLSAMADLAAECGDEALKSACERVWEDLCLRNMYVTGGIGPSRHNEGFTRDYDLPNESAYCETCAAIGLVFWNHRLLQLDCDGRYADVMEWALYNGVISGVSLDGTKFFYENPLSSAGGHHRQDWFGCACCPPNLARILASLGGYVYSEGDGEAIVHLYVGGEGRLSVGGTAVRLVQETDYPWSGDVRIEVHPESRARFALRLRMPGWCRGAGIRVNGVQVDLADVLERGYARIERVWEDGDVVELDLPMPVERVYAHPEATADAGRVALQRGPIVYCLEDADNPVSVHRIVLSEDAKLVSRFDEALLGGVVVIEGDAYAASEDGWDGTLYRTEKPRLDRVRIRAIPYYAWDNREPGGMTVWVIE